jgi:hypothetical protein
MQKMFGFSGFATTKGQAVDGNQKVGEVDVKDKKKQRQYRQYLYVKGSYSIPLTQEDLKQHQATEQSAKGHNEQFKKTHNKP